MRRLKVRQIAAIAVLSAGLAWTSGSALAQEIASAHPDDQPAALTQTPLSDARTPSLLGDWTAIDPATGMRETVTVTAESLTFGAAPPLPYYAEGVGDGLALWLGDGEVPLHLHFFDAANAQLSVPGGPAITLRREPPRGAAAEPVVVKIPESDTIAEAAAALLPPSAPFP